MSRIIYFILDTIFRITEVVEDLMKEFIENEVNKMIKHENSFNGNRYWQNE